MAMGIGLIGGAVSAIGSIMGGQANAAMYNYQAAVANMNAGIAKQNAAAEVSLGESQLAQQGQKQAAQKGAIKAQLGASNLDLNSGSPASIQSSENLVIKEEQANTQFSAARRAYGDQIVAVQDTAQAQLDTQAAGFATQAGTIGAFSSILSGIGGTFAKSQQAQAVGLSGNPLSSGGLFGGNPGLNL